MRRPAAKIIAVLIAAASPGLAAPRALGQAPAPAPEANTTVAPVTVTARRQTPAELTSRASNCIKAAQDPILRAWAGQGAMPVIYADTRLPRNPDWSAAPLSLPGSAMPKVLSLKERAANARRGSTGGSGFAASGGGDDAGGDGGDRMTVRGISGDLSVEDVIALCEARDLPGQDETRGAPFDASSEMFVGQRPGPQFADGLRRIKLNDKTLPLGFALFDEGRYAEAMVQFKAAWKKLPETGGGDEAALMVGKVYLFGLGDKSDPVQAAAWLKKTADGYFNPESNMPMFDPREPERNTAVGEASLILAELYRTGRGAVPKDMDACIRYLKRAVKVGHVPAGKTLGDLYYEGVETPRDLKAAFKAYMDAAKFAHVPSMIAVAQMYEAGEVSGAPEPARALAWRAEAASQDDPDSLFVLARAYERGETVPSDPERALALYKLAAVNGQAGAQAAIGTYFYNGEGGLPRDLGLARRWFRQAALAGDGAGMFNLAVMTAKGEGGPADQVAAWGWFRVANLAGHPRAAAAVRAMETGFTPQDRARADDYLAKRGG